jgi:hypothetical protein
MRRLLAASLVGITALSVTACSGGGGKDQALHAKRAAAQSKRSTSTTTLPFVSTSKHVPGTLTGFVGAKTDVHDTKCDRAGASWNAAGKVTNPTKHAVRYRIYVSFLQGDTTVGIGEFDSPTVAARATAPFSTGVKVAGDDLRCLLRVERADA